MKGTHPKSGKRGFALVATITIMTLVALIALAMLTLSIATTRAQKHGSAQAEAQANARVALMLAIGELQQHTGSDMRVTAPADILSSGNPPLLGVWRSWEGSNHQVSGNLRGRPIAPDYASKQTRVSEDGRFVSWLVSGAAENAHPSDAASLVSSTASSGTVPLVSRGSLADDDTREVHVIPQQLENKAKIAWWISGENQKARLPKPYDEEEGEIAGWIDRARSHSVADPEPFGLEAVIDDASLANKAITRRSADLINASESGVPKHLFHDLSATSVGLLTNTATGGWRKDLSLLTESWDSQPTSGLELFKVTPSDSLEFTKPTLPDNYRPEKSLFYHWSDYRDHRAEQIFHHRGPVTSWTCLANYATLYKNLTTSSAGNPQIQAQTWPYRGHPNMYNGLHRPWVMPQITRVQIVISHYATRTHAAPNKLRPAVMYTPIFTLWNPFNTEITLPGRLHIRAGYSLPVALKYSLPGVSASDDYWAVQGPQDTRSYPNNRLTAGWNYGWEIRFETNPLVLKPGETKVFSPAEDFIEDQTYVTRQNRRNYNSLKVYPGVRTGVGFYYSLDRILQPGVANTSQIDPDKVSMDPGTTLQADAKFDAAAQNYNGSPGCGLNIQWNINQFRDPQHGNITAHYRPDQADDLYPPLTELADVTLAECEDNPVPFLSMIYGLRTANHTATPTKGMVQSSPLVAFTATGLNSWHSDLYPGGKNPMNAPWDLSYIPHPTGPGDDMLPNADNTTDSGYIVTGVRKAEGIASTVMAEIPTRPLASLGDLTHWHIRGVNPVPPHGHNLIGNSDAHPLISRNSVVNETNNTYANQRRNEQHDDSYCANHILFDDWFFSSITPAPDTFGQSGRTLRENYIDFLTGDEPLTNRAYRPIAQDMATDDTDADETYSSHVQSIDSWKTIASRLEVEGMFNVNSTSVKAWRALLGHARNQKVPYVNAQGSISLSDSTDYAFPRTSIAGDEKAGTPKPGAYFATTEFAGYRVFTDPILDKLAEEIVEQVRLRGPFLSLSEFVNRQLSNDDDLAIAGAIQTALNKLTADNSLNPFDVMQGESYVSLADPLGEDDYVFGKAAEGHNTYGLPGWTRQADILRPLAPILAARDDTFTIRAYGESRAADGTVLARAWCEATVQRSREFFDPSDESDILTQPTEITNQTYGRRYKIVSFRWLNADEV